MELKAFDDLLSKHDWDWFLNSDLDPESVGEARQARLIEISKISPSHFRLYDAYDRYNHPLAEMQIDEQELMKVRLELGVVAAAPNKKKSWYAVKRNYIRSLIRHDWWYWQKPIGSKEYANGLQHRTSLLNYAKKHQEYKALWDLARMDVAEGLIAEGAIADQSARLFIVMTEMGMTPKLKS